MVINCDRFFVEELRRAGLDVDYKKVVKLYQQSRRSPGCIARQRRKEQEYEAMLEFDALVKP